METEQGVEDDPVDLLCIGGPEVAWDLIQAYLAAEYSRQERHLRRLGKIATLEDIVTRKS